MKKIKEIIGNYKTTKESLHITCDVNSSQQSLLFCILINRKAKFKVNIWLKLKKNLKHLDVI